MYLSQTIQRAIESGAIREGATVEATPLIRIYETLVGIGTVARTCDHLLRQPEPDLAELHLLVANLIAASNDAITIIRD